MWVVGRLGAVGLRGGALEWALISAHMVVEGVRIYPSVWGVNVLMGVWYPSQTLMYSECQCWANVEPLSVKLLSILSI